MPSTINKNQSWAESLPPKQGLYDPSLEKDACGVGFAAHIKGIPSHKIVSDASVILCNMTHRGATGADFRDGDGAGVMTSMPYEFFNKEADILGVKLPPPGQYATGNLFFNPNTIDDQKARFEKIATSFDLNVLCWREVPVDSSILGPVSLSREPKILQPFITLNDKTFDSKTFTKKLYLLRKVSSHNITLKEWFYICSLATENITYKGQLSPIQVYKYFLDLGNHRYTAHFALVHSRFSTNTFPSWNRAQPLRFCAHNGEINTLRGNKNWMRAREGIMKSTFFGKDLEKLYPIIEPDGSDSAAFDNVLELLLMNGKFSLPEVVMIMAPEAWQNNPNMDPKKKAFYKWAACLMEPWDGPALFTFSDGRYIGASLDRNGLRPCRYYVLEGDRIVCASEVGTITIDPATVIKKGRLQPGRMLLVDTVEGRIVDDTELKSKVAEREDFGKWIDNQMLSLEELKAVTLENSPTRAYVLDPVSVARDPRMTVFGFTLEQINFLILPMIKEGKEALGSMGNDNALACLSTQVRPIYEYFRQLFAQVTNPPIDPIREEIVMSLECYIGPEGNILEIEESQCHRMTLPSPIIDIDELASIKNISKYVADWSVKTLSITFKKELGPSGYLEKLNELCESAVEAINEGVKVIVLSDNEADVDNIPISSLIASGAVHQHLISNKLRSKVALVVETGEAREVHHFCVLLGYGADAICPYLALEAILKLKRDGLLEEEIDGQVLIKNYKKASSNGILKVMSKMGISTLQSYKGAQIFEALGISEEVIEKCFNGTASRIKGSTFEMLAQDAIRLHEAAYPTRYTENIKGLPEVGEYHWRKGGQKHINEPVTVAKLQDAVRNKNKNAYDEYAKACHDSIRNCTLRGLLDFDFEKSKGIPIDEVEPWDKIVKRFCTGAMSYGSISMEAHSTLAAAMNELGGKSNTGEGGEDPQRASGLVDGKNLRSAIKQVASGRFGVTSFYLTNADELQIKMAQGAKPGEGGELPGHKVSENIAKTRKSTAGVGLISPPPHHDIYSIEDLKQLIYDLKTSNPRARVSVKLVSEVGVGIVASGVAKAKADHILISGHDGGTGASRWTGIKYAGLPWELGLAETHQTLVLNDLRGRVVLQTDGQIKTGRDVALACLLGAEEWGFATTPLIAMGCTMMRKCHLNTCPVGIATQDPELRAKFTGLPEHVINFFYYVAEELREIMAKLGLRTINEMVGRCEKLKLNLPFENRKAASLDLSSILVPAYKLRPGAATYCVRKQDHKLHTRLDNKLIAEAELAITNKEPITIDTEIVNTDRTLGSTLSYQISKLHGEEGLPNGTVHVFLKGSAGQSFGAFLAPGVTLELQGDANDYVGKGLSGGIIAIYPPKASKFKANENIIVGNVCLYGATSGSAFISGVAAERFAVRNSGATAVIEGVGDHGCEYMTGGRVVILGNVGRNFAAGMSGGIAYVLNRDKVLSENCNKEMVHLESVEDKQDISELKELIYQHYIKTGSEIAKEVYHSFDANLSQFIKVMPIDYKLALKKKEEEAKQVKTNGHVNGHTNGHINGDAKLEENRSKNLHQHKAIGDIEDVTPDEELIEKKLKLADKVRGFIKYKRRGDHYREPNSRLKDWNEVNHRLKPSELKVQSARCMDCGVPFCQSDTGCPIGNIIPKWNDLVFKGKWREALDRLMMTNNFPEFTGRVCPAPCEGACVLGINSSPVSIKSIECAIIDKGFEENWIVAKAPKFRTGKKVAIIGSGPAGLAAADQLNKAGHLVTVYDRNDRAGGLLMYGIPNMKLDKKIVQRRLDLLEEEGIQFVLNTEVGTHVSFGELQGNNDAVLMATGATWPRDLNIPNRQSNGIYFAMDFLQKNTSALLNSQFKDRDSYISAKDKNVIVIGGGDTGCDCIGTSVRHGAKSIVNFELLPEPPAQRGNDNPWPQFPRVFKVDYGHEEVQKQYSRDPREYCILSKEFVTDENGNVKGINTVRVQWEKDSNGRWKMQEIERSEKFFEADLVLLAMGFLGPESKVVKEAGLDTTQASNISTPKDQYATSVKGVFAAGDCRRGQSLIVWGINEGRQAAREIDHYLIGNTKLPVSGGLVELEFNSLEANSVSNPIQNKIEVLA
ncbi:glutamate synthase [Neoconidiobolus thromboides FSU 785]|nr:glutamate synthase [Neoconidiobolus thromboides FSU 785]